MAFQIGSNFDLKSQLPLDVRTVVANQTERNNLAPSQAYAGLIVYVTGENKYYYYNGTNWIELNITGGGGSANLNYTYVSASTTVTKNTKIAADTLNSSFTITLPTSNLNVGDVVEIIDLNKTFHLRSLIIAGAPSVIEGSSAGLTCNVRGANFILIWVGGSVGWEISVIDNNSSTFGVVESNNNFVPLLYLRIQGTNELFDSPDSQNYKIPWNRVEWFDERYTRITNQNIIDNSKMITYNSTNKNIFFKDSGIYNIDLRYSSYNLIDSTDFLRARLRSSNSPITGGLADLNQSLPRTPIGFVDPNASVLAAFAQGPIGTSFNGEGMQAGFTTFLITGNTYMTTDFLHFGALNTTTNQTRGFPVFTNDFGNQPFAFITKIA